LQALLLVISALLIWVPLPIPARGDIAAIIAVVVAFWLMTK
jgi:hypothetical protein